MPSQRGLSIEKGTQDKHDSVAPGHASLSWHPHLAPAVTVHQKRHDKGLCPRVLATNGKARCAFALYCAGA